MRDDFYPEYLEHHGILGMRWGIMNGPPYPLSRQEHNKVVKKAKGEKKGNFISDMKAKSAAKKKAKKRAESLAKARAARAERAKREAYERKLEADKERVLKSGTATELAKYKGRLTNKELQDAWSRLEYEAKILSKAEAENVKPDKVKDFFDRLETLSGYVKKGTDAVKVGIDAYDTYVDVYNRFAKPSEPLSKIRGGGNDNNNKKKDNNSNNGVTKDDIEKLLKKYSDNQNQNNGNNKKKRNR